jgi:predicted MFS family arabinose efflux permease
MSQAKALSSPSGIFYGWWNVGASFVGLALSYAMFTVFAFGVFVGPLSNEFGWNRFEMARAYSITNLTIVFAAPVLGILIDRYGVRRVLLPSLVLMGLAVASMSQLTGSIYHFYAMYLLIPLLGAGTLPTSYSRTVIAWFFRSRGIALGVALAGFGVGAALVPPLAQMLIEEYGWRNTYLVFSGLIFVIALPVTFFLLRESPKDMGLEIDGEPQQSDKNNCSNATSGLSLNEASRTSSFWLILLAFLLVGIGISSVIAHMVPMLTDRGVSPRVAALCQMSMGLGLIFGRILSGYLMDRFFAPYIAATFTLMFVVGAAILATGTSSYLIFVAAIAIGLSTGSEISETAYLVSRYFGAKAYCMIYGIMFSAFQLGSSIGPPSLGKYFVINGNYQNALWVLAGLAFIGALLVAVLRAYPNFEEQTASG